MEHVRVASIVTTALDKGLVFLIRHFSVVVRAKRFGNELAAKILWNIERFGYLVFRAIANKEMVLRSISRVA